MGTQRSFCNSGCTATSNKEREYRSTCEQGNDRQEDSKREESKISKMSETEDKVYIKVPTFDGDKEKWLIFKAKMESYLAQKDMVVLLSFTGEVPKDTEIWTADELKDAANKRKLTVQRQNRRAAGTLLGCINTSTQHGEAAFHLVQKFMDPSTGYAGGNFKKAWAAMTKRYEDTDTVSKADLKRMYFETMMEPDEAPSLFIVKMEKLRSKLANEAAFTMTDDEFMLDILAKLPKGKQEGEMGPYQIEKRIIEPLIVSTTIAYDLDRLTLDLEKVYNDIHGEKDDDEGNGKGKKEHTDRAFAAYTKQFKGRCRKCGKYGHMAKDCRNPGNGNQGGNGGRSFSEKKKFTGKCFYCDKPGHQKKDCRKRIADQRNRTNDQGNRASEPDEIAFCAIEEGPNVDRWRKESREAMNAQGWGDEDSDSDDSSVPPPPLIQVRLVPVDDTDSESETSSEGPPPLIHRKMMQEDSSDEDGDSDDESTIPPPVVRPILDRKNTSESESSEEDSKPPPLITRKVSNASISSDKGSLPSLRPREQTEGADTASMPTLLHDDDSSSSSGSVPSLVTDPRLKVGSKASSTDEIDFDDAMVKENEIVDNAKIEIIGMELIESDHSASIVHDRARRCERERIISVVSKNECEHCEQGSGFPNECMGQRMETPVVKSDSRPKIHEVSSTVTPIKAVTTLDPPTGTDPSGRHIDDDIPTRNQDDDNAVENLKKGRHGKKKKQKREQSRFSRTVKNRGRRKKWCAEQRRNHDGCPFQRR